MVQGRAILTMEDR